MENEMDKIVEDIQKYNLTDTQTIQARKRSILKNLVVDTTELSHYQSLLKEYRYVDEIDELRLGSYIRFFRLDTETLDLRTGGFLADIQIYKQQVQLLFKNRNRFYKINMNTNILFQKNTTQEKILIQILDQIKG
jgi:hypothetical protein